VTLAEASGNSQDALLAARACALSEKTDINPARLLRLVEDGVKEPQGKPLRLRVQALVCLRIGPVEEAVRQLEALRKSDPDRSPAIDHLLLSIALARLVGRSEDAGWAFERAQREAVPVTHVHETLEYQVLLREARKSLSEKRR
jgi:hypothetical protein